MSKYIDVEKLIAEIERLEHENCMNGGEHFCMRRAICLGNLRNIITPLYHERTEVDVEKEIDASIRLMPGVHSLEDNKQWYKGRYEIIKELALYFYKLGLNARKA